MTSDRSYRKKLPEEVAVKTISENKGSQFDPQVADVFVKLHQQGKIVS
jgi:HD-GYP domain-containing protein (c-di-GMP phosphodiesterase class II)